MNFVFAHGPWWSEWHHVLPLIPAGVAYVAVYWAKWRRK